MIDLLKLGLKEDSTFPEIQIAINAAGLITKEELNVKTNEAAAGARKATEAKLKDEYKNSNKLSKEDAELFTKLKKQEKTKTLKENDILKKFEDDDFNLIVAAEGLADISDEKELETKISEIGKKYGKKMKNEIPNKIVKPEESVKHTQQKSTETPGEVKQYIPGSLGIFGDN